MVVAVSLRLPRRTPVSTTAGTTSRDVNPAATTIFETAIRQATLGLAAAFGIKVPGDPLAPTISVIVLGTVLVGAVVLASWRLARFEVRGGD